MCRQKSLDEEESNGMRNEEGRQRIIIIKKKHMKKHVVIIGGFVCALIKDWVNECYCYNIGILFPFEPTDISKEEMRWMECEIRNVVRLA